MLKVRLSVKDRAYWEERVGQEASLRVQMVLTHTTTSPFGQSPMECAWRRCWEKVSGGYWRLEMLLMGYHTTIGGILCKNITIIQIKYHKKSCHPMFMPTVTLAPHAKFKVTNFVVANTIHHYKMSNGHHGYMKCLKICPKHMDP